MPLPESHRKLYIRLNYLKNVEKTAIRLGDLEARNKARDQISKITEQIANLGKYERFKGLK